MPNFTTYFGTFDILSKSSFLQCIQIVTYHAYVNQKLETFGILLILLNFTTALLTFDVLSKCSVLTVHLESYILHLWKYKIRNISNIMPPIFTTYRGTLDVLSKSSFFTVKLRMLYLRISK